MTSSLVEAGPPETKASGFNSVVTILRSMLDADGFADLVRHLPRESAALIETPPLSVSWIPAMRYGELLATLSTHSFGGDERRITELARRAVAHDLNTFYRVFIKLMSPRHVIERGAKLWLTYNRNNGVLRSTPTSEHTCDVFYQGVVTVFPHFWTYQRGCLAAALQATGYKQADAKLISGGGRSGDAVFTVRWGP